jgi:hypothetical protein
MIIRQGDLVLKLRSTEVPAEGSDERLVLAVGESSGHAHVVDGTRVGDVLSVRSPSVLRVEPPSMEWRHRSINIDPGTYDVIIQREYRPEGAAPVHD